MTEDRPSPAAAPEPPEPPRFRDPLVAVLTAAVTLVAVAGTATALPLLTGLVHDLLMDAWVRYVVEFAAFVLLSLRRPPGGGPSDPPAA